VWSKINRSYRCCKWRLTTDLLSSLITDPNGMWSVAKMERQIHCLEIHAYNSLLKAFIAQSEVLTWVNIYSKLVLCDWVSLVNMLLQTLSLFMQCICLKYVCGCREKRGSWLKYGRNYILQILNMEKCCWNLTLMRLLNG
jgi:hypothetical protein